MEHLIHRHPFFRRQYQKYFLFDRNGCKWNNSYSQRFRAPAHETLLNMTKTFFFASARATFLRCCVTITAPVSGIVWTSVQLNISRPRRHIKDQIIQITPGHICYKLFDCAACHWSAPDNGIIGLTKKPIDITLTPYFSSGWSFTVQNFRFSSIPNIKGALGPYTSASKSPTFAPSMARATAMFHSNRWLADTPFPLCNSDVFFTPERKSSFCACVLRCTSEVIDISILSYSFDSESYCFLAIYDKLISHRTRGGCELQIETWHRFPWL